MKTLDLLFLNIIAHSLSKKSYQELKETDIDSKYSDFAGGGYKLPVNESDWTYLHKIADMQKLWPIVFDQTSDTPEYCSLSQELQNDWMNEAVSTVAYQTIQTEELASVCNLLKDEKIRYVVLKGISCRRYYPNPDFRPSGDEDILIDWRDYRKCDRLLKEQGYISEDEYDPDKVQDKREAHYRAKDGFLYLEVHFNAVGIENQRQQRLNAFFEDALEHSITVEYEGYNFSVLEPTYQLIHILSHFYRHLYESGVGIRQMLDVLLAAKEKDVDWTLVEKILRKTQMKKIFAAVLNANEQYFKMNLECVPVSLRDDSVNPELMIEDMLNGGIYGFGEKGDRHLSENFTLEIDTEQNQWLRVLFPSQQRLADRYNVLYKHPERYLIYVVARWFALLKKHMYKKESREKLKSSVATGKKRRNILEQYRD